MSFESQIQKWISLDNELKKLNEQVTKIREQRSQLCENITNYANNNNLIHSTVNIGDGRLKFANTNIPEPLTFKYLEKNLGEIIKNESQVKLIIEHLKKKRTIKTIPEIKRFSTK